LTLTRVVTEQANTWRTADHEGGPSSSTVVGSRPGEEGRRFVYHPDAEDQPEQEQQCERNRQWRDEERMRQMQEQLDELQPQ
jgi:hypothetical protein